MEESYEQEDFAIDIIECVSCGYTYSEEESPAQCPCCGWYEEK